MDPNPAQLRALSTLVNAYQEIGWNHFFWFVESRNNLLQGCTILSINQHGETLILEEDKRSRPKFKSRIIRCGTPRSIGSLLKRAL